MCTLETSKISRPEDFILLETFPTFTFFSIIVFDNLKQLILVLVHVKLRKPSYIFVNWYHFKCFVLVSCIRKNKRNIPKKRKERKKKERSKT